MRKRLRTVKEAKNAEKCAHRANQLAGGPNRNLLLGSAKRGNSRRSENVIEKRILQCLLFIFLTEEVFIRFAYRNTEGACGGR
jgi:hypothetical protein